ncbi:MAG: uroporphyrinogen decarboxylase [Chloroflexi bacterium]|nr:uroporphyrinogen decarboxylase [Chloroflexota bacterium]
MQTPEDWDKLIPHNPHSGHLAEQLGGLKMIVDALEPGTPVLETVFSPLAQARKLAGDARLLKHLQEHPERLRRALKIITESTRRFILAATQAGISGIFYAVQHARAGQLSAREYAEVAREDDLACLEAASGLWLNALHLHGADVHFDLLADYPVQVINWHDRETPPSLAEGSQRFSGLVCGGLRQEETLVFGTPEHVQREARNALEATDGKRLILGTGCVSPIIAPHGNLMAARRAVENG